MLKIRKLLICKDGFEMSVQASSGHYCTPRIDDADFYTAYEIGFPSQKESLIMKYAEEKKRPTETVYGYVPTEIVCKVIKKHGGLK